MSKPTCGTCPAYEGDPDGSGWCHYDPPRLVQDGEHFFSTFPGTHEDEFCMKHPRLSIQPPRYAPGEVPPPPKIRLKPEIEQLNRQRVEGIYRYWRERFKSHNPKARCLKKASDESRKKTLAAIRKLERQESEDPVADMKLAIDGLFYSDWHTKNELLTFDMLFKKADSVERFIQKASMHLDQAPTSIAFDTAGMVFYPAGVRFVLKGHKVTLSQPVWVDFEKGVMHSEDGRPVGLDGA